MTKNKDVLPQKVIAHIIQQINQHWLRKNYGSIGEYLAEQVTIALPGLETRICGREAYIQSYREYDQAVITHEFKADPPQIDVIDDVAVAVCPFFIVYEREEKTYRERGQEILVLMQWSGKWQIVWRTMVSNPSQ